MVLFDMVHQPARAMPKRRTIYLRKKADTEGSKTALESSTARSYSRPPSDQPVTFGRIIRTTSTTWSKAMYMYLLSVQQSVTIIHEKILDSGAHQDENTELTKGLSTRRIHLNGKVTSA